MTKEDMHNFGYIRVGMIPITKDEAETLFDGGYPIYLLYSDNTESLVRECCEMYEHDGMFGMDEVKSGASLIRNIKSRYGYKD